MKKSRRSSKSMVNPVMLAIAGVALLAVALGIVVLGSDDSQPSSSTDNAANGAIPFPDVPRVSLADAKARYDDETAIFVDVRSAQEYEAAHIPGALSLSLTELQTSAAGLPSDALIYLYCT